jgi:hypothetical protein
MALKRPLEIFLLLILSLSTGCKNESNYFVDESASEGGGNDSGAPNTGTGFRFRLKTKTGVEAFVHKFGDTTAACEIAKADVDNPSVINCMINMMEYDVWYHGFEYELNVPSGFCSYIEERPYLYFQYGPGRAPAAAAMTVTNGNITACTVNGAAALSFSATSCDTGEGTILPGGTFNCAYDYSKIDDDYPNCCEGKMQLTLTTVNTTTTPSTTATTTTELEGGGKAEKCLDGPHGYISNWPKSQDNADLPISTLLQLANSSYTRTLKIPSEFEARSQRPLTWGNTFIAGFHGWTQYAASASTWSTTRTIPRAFAPLRDLGPTGDYAAGTSIGSVGDGSYQFSCRGPAGELRHRIRVYVNEWNTVEDFTAFKTNGNAAAVDPSRTGTAGVDCAAVNTGDTCNSFWGFDDLIKEFGAGSPSAYVFPGFYTPFAP